MPQRQRRGAPASKEKKEVRFIDVLAGFSKMDVLKDPDLHKYLSVKVRINDKIYNALLDTGINMNLIHQNLYNECKMNPDVQKQL